MERNALLARITINPEVCNGRPTIRGKRITAQTILELLSAGEGREEILRQYPSLEPEDIDACLAFAAWLLEGTMNDLAQYTRDRAARDPEFAENLESGYTEFKIGILLRQAAKRQGRDK